MTTTPPPSWPALTPLDYEVATHAQRGWAIESRTPTMAVLTSGGKPNHVLHLILTLVTFGLWALVWICIAATSRVVRLTLIANPDGTVSRVEPRKGAAARPSFWQTLPGGLTIAGICAVILVAVILAAGN